MEFSIWYKQSAFRFEHQERVLYIDPWDVPEGEPKADWILVTHGHFDHFDPPTIERLRKPSTAIVAPKDIITKLAGGSLVAVEPNEQRVIEGLSVETVPAYNIGKDFHPSENRWVGYVVTVNGTRFYHAGDTDCIPEMRTIACDVALLPIGGTYTMDVKEAVEAAAMIGAKATIPMHYGFIVGSKEDGERFRQAASVPVELLKPRLPFER